MYKMYMLIFNIDLDHKHTGEDQDGTDPNDVKERPTFGKKVPSAEKVPKKRQKFRQIVLPQSPGMYIEQAQKRKDIY